MASYLDSAALVTTGAALVMYKDRLDVTVAQVGALSGLLTLMFAVGALFGGRLGDIYGRRRVFTTSLALYLAGVLTLAGAVETWMLILGVILTGLAIGADLPVSLALIDEESPAEDRGRMVAFTSMLWAGGVLGASLAITLVGRLEDIGARIAYLHLAVVAAIVFVLRARTPESRKWNAARHVADKLEDRASEVTRSGTTLNAGDGAPSVHAEAIDFSRIPDLFRKPVSSAVIATGLYYALWNLAANTLGAFSAFMWVELADQSVETQPMWSALSLPFAIGGIFIFMRVVDTERRFRWLVFGSVLGAAAWLAPLLLGPTAVALVLLIVLFHISASFSGEIIFKVWSQETMPVLLRSTGQGVTIAFARFIAAGGAVLTPTLAVAAPRLLCAILVGCCVLSTIIGLLWAQRLPKATEPLAQPDWDSVPNPPTPHQDTVQGPTLSKSIVAPSGSIEPVGGSR